MKLDIGKLHAALLTKIIMNDFHKELLNFCQLNFNIASKIPNFYLRSAFLRD